MNLLKRPHITEVTIKDRFWTPYLENIREIMLPYVFSKFRTTGYIKNFESVKNRDGEKHIGPPFTDGLLFESMRGACDFLASNYDKKLDEKLDELIALISKSTDSDGFICTKTMQNYPDQRWGENGGDIIIAHDLYDHGALIEAAISHYIATKKTTFLKTAVNSANLICRYMGYAPKKKIVPGHSLPEEAFVKLYRLFRDTRELDDFAKENKVNFNDYLEIADFWYKERGIVQSKKFTLQYNQNHKPFAQQDSAVGHAVRAMLFYTGAAAVAYETDNEKYKEVLKTLWHNVVDKKMHISGGLGTRHDIEGFDTDYNLPNNAYLETCAGVGFAFWNGEMALLDQKSRYFDCFELALYNNILASIGNDFTHYFYQNPLVNATKLHRWDWHECPCCPPMLLKLFSTLGTYIYSYANDCVYVNMFIGSTYETDSISISQQDKVFNVNSKGQEISLYIRIPSYSENFAILIDGKATEFTTDNGYAIIKGVFNNNTEIKICFDEPVRRIFANPMVESDLGKVAVMKGAYVLCAEGVDNDSVVDFTINAEPNLTWHGDKAEGLTKDGKKFTLIPYHKWCNRSGEDEETKMAVWFNQDNMLPANVLSDAINGKLYGIYENL